MVTPFQIFVVAAVFVALAAVCWVLAPHTQRGWTDESWDWGETHRAVGGLALVFGLMAAVTVVRFGIGDRAMKQAIVSLIFLSLPYLAYASGRLAGLRHRARRAPIAS
jgi:small-conductance mechanosensitive channel